MNTKTTIQPTRTQLIRLSGLVTLRMSGVALQMLILILLGRVVGPSGVAVMQVFTTWVSLLGELVAVGTPTQAMRRLSVVSVIKQRHVVIVFLRRCATRVTAAWCMLSVILISLLFLPSPANWPLPDWISNQLWILSIATLSFALIRLAAEGLKAQDRTNLGIFGESALPPLIAVVYLLVMWFLNASLDRNDILYALCLGFGLTSCVLLISLLAPTKRNEKPQLQAPSDSLELKWSQHLPLWVTALVSIGFLNYPFIVLPGYASMAEIGAFALAFKLLNLVTTILLMISAIYSPRFSRCDRNNDIEEAQRLLHGTQLICLTLYIPIMLTLLLTYPYLHDYFGDGFAQGSTFLLILAFGQACNAAAGLSGMLLNMMGQGRKEMWVQTGTLLFALALTPLAGGHFGIIGITVLYSGTVAIKSACSYYLAKTYLNNLRRPNHLNNQMPHLIEPLNRNLGVTS